VERDGVEDVPSRLSAFAKLILIIQVGRFLCTHLDRIKPTASRKEKEKHGGSSNPFHERVLRLSLCWSFELRR
jgi:hypothetical protein